MQFHVLIYDSTYIIREITSIFLDVINSYPDKQIELYILLLRFDKCHESQYQHSVIKTNSCRCRTGTDLCPDVCRNNYRQEHSPFNKTGMEETMVLLKHRFSCEIFLRSQYRAYSVQPWHRPCSLYIFRKFQHQ